jgi:hypothetical protein
MTKRGVEVDPKYNRYLKNLLKDEDPEFIDAFAAEARKHYNETGEIVSLTNKDMLYRRANERLQEIKRLRDNLYHGDYVDASGVTQSYSSEQLNNFSKGLRNHNTEMSYVDPGAQRLN